MSCREIVYLEHSSSLIRNIETQRMDISLKISKFTSVSLLAVNINSNCAISGISFVIFHFKDLTKPDPCHLNKVILTTNAYFYFLYLWRTIIVPDSPMCLIFCSSSANI